MNRFKEDLIKSTAFDITKYVFDTTGEDIDITDIMSLINYNLGTFIDVEDITSEVIDEMNELVGDEEV